MALVAVSCELFSGEFRLTGKLTGTWRFSGHHFAADSWYVIGRRQIQVHRQL
jgi:hypothetical protein